MANIQWNKVTWYSKLIAAAIFVILPFVGLYYGIQYGENIGQANQAAQMPAATSTMPQAGGSGSAYYTNTAEWQVGQSNNGGFSIAYPIDFSIDQNYSVTPSTDWRLGANSNPGNLYFTITVPSAFEPQTNFADAKLTVGASANNKAVADCLVADPSGGPPSATSTTTINGIQFTVFKSSDAGAGNYYETTSYRTVYSGQCYAIEYTVHSSQIGNYPPQYNLQPFDDNQITSLMDRIVGTFQFN
jgi:hypothetical protein